MSSTWSSGKSVAAFRASPTSPIYYLLMAGTKESNVFPRRTSWGAVAFGTAKEVMRLVLRCASSAEGGMLKGGNGNVITPETYIGQWRAELRKPHVMSPSATRVCIKFGTGLYQVPHRARDLVKEQLEWVQYESSENMIELNLAHDGVCEALSSALDVAREAGCHAWRVFSCDSRHTEVDVSLAYKVKRPAQRAALPFAVLKLPNQASSEPSHVVISDSGRIALEGWAYSVVGGFVCEYAAQQEEIDPGCAEDLITTFREMVRQAKAIDPQTHVVAKRMEDDGEDSRYSNEKFSKLCKALGLDDNVKELKVKIGDIAEANALRHLEYMKDGCVVFDQAEVIRQVKPLPQSQQDLELEQLSGT